MCLRNTTGYKAKWKGGLSHRPEDFLAEIVPLDTPDLSVELHTLALMNLLERLYTNATARPVCAFARLGFSAGGGGVASLR